MLMKNKITLLALLTSLLISIETHTKWFANYRLERAVKNGDTQAAQGAINDNADINAKKDALMRVAIDNKNKNIVDFLIRHNANKQVALQHAIDTGNNDMQDHLFFNHNATSNDQTFLQRQWDSALKNGNLDKINLLTSRYNFSTDKALQNAITYKMQRLAHVLYQQGANTKDQDFLQDELNFAIHNGNADFKNRILQDPNFDQQAALLDASNRNDRDTIRAIRLARHQQSK